MPTKPVRTCKLQVVEGTLVLSISLDRGTSIEVNHYHVEELPSDGERVLKLTKFSVCGGEVYEVHLSNGKSSCGCPGHQRWGHKILCKHIAALRKLIALGRL